MSNHIEQAAISVLKEHELKIRFSPILSGGVVAGYEMDIGPVPTPKMAEIREAIEYLAPAAQISTKQDEKLKKHSNLHAAARGMHGAPDAVLGREDEIAYAANPIGNVAQLLANNGVNFPGSEKFRSPGATRG